MALEPKGLYGEGWWDEKTPELPPGVTPPSGVDWSSGNYYAHFRINNDGTREIQWYQRGPGRPWYQPQLPGTTAEPAKPDPVLTTTTDQLPAGSEVAKAWAAAQSKETATAQRGDQEGDTRGPQNGPQREVYRSGKWITENNPLYQANSAASASRPPVPPGGKSETEGTPDPSKPGGWDNQRPRQVIKDKDGNVVWSEELTGADLTAWRAAQQASQPQTGESRTQVTNRPGWTSIKRKRVEGGNTTEVETFIGPDGKEVPTLPPETKSDRKPVEGQPGLYIVSKSDGTTTDAHFENEAGQTVQAPPNTPASIVSGGTTYIKGPDGTYKPAQGVPSTSVGNIKDLPAYTPDLTKPGQGLYEYGQALDEYAKTHPDFTWEKRTAVMAEAQKLATTVANEFNTGAAVLRENFQSQVTQRGQDMTQSNSRAQLANEHTQNATALIEKFAPYLGVTPGDAGKLFMGMMASQLATATMYGGMKDSPQVSMDPRLMAFADRTVGAAGASGSAAVPGAPGAPAPAFPLGPSGLANPTVAQAQAANPAGAAGIMANPAFSPQPPATPDTALAEGIRQAQAANAAGGVPTPGEPGGPPLVPGAVLPTPGVSDPRDAPGYTGPPTAPAPAPTTPVAPVGPLSSVIPPGGGPGYDAPLAPDAEMVIITDQYGNRSQVPKAKLASRPGGVGDLKIEPYIPGSPLPPGVTPYNPTPQAASAATPLPAIAPINPPVGDPGNNPLTPVGMAPLSPGLSTLFTGAFPPTWRQQADQNRDYLAGPVGRPPLPMTTQIPGLSPEVDAEARRQLQAEGLLV